MMLPSLNSRLLMVSHTVMLGPSSKRCCTSSGKSLTKLTRTKSSNSRQMSLLGGFSR